jgi:glycosyltransferase involved in cell wall biosynthesis
VARYIEAATEVARLHWEFRERSVRDTVQCLVRVLILNWRDVRSPRAGGAETLTHEIARRFVPRHEVVWFTSRPAGLPAEEEIDGIQIVRRGSELSTRFSAPAFARHRHWDVVVEEINTLPYLSPLWSRSPTVLLIPQLAREVWWYEAPRFLAQVGYHVEPLYLAVYRNVTTVTISPSTRDDLRELGTRSPIHVIPMAVSTPALDDLPPKTPSARLVAVGRLVPSKRFDHAIRALAEVRQVLESATLTIVGEGPERPRLERLADELGVGNAVQLAGRVSESAKVEILERSDLLVACSVREGWGLTPTEAARLGTPAVVYDIPGLRDSVVHERTGLLASPQPTSLADAVARVMADSTLYQSLRERAWWTWRHLSWDRTASAFERAILPKC